MHIDLLSLFPGYFTGPLDETIIGRARRRGVLKINTVDIRSFGEGKHRQVDDKSYGGGTGMVMMPGPLKAAIESVRGPKSRVVHLSPQGKPLTAATCRRLAKESHLVLLSGHYEGIDQRIIDQEVDEEISIGDYVLTNGCLAALVLLDAVARFVPGVLKEAATHNESFERPLFDWPHYTQPQEFCGKRVPEVLLQGNHEKIGAWRHQAAVAKTAKVRPELFAQYVGQLAPFGQEPVQVVGMVRELKRSKRFYKDLGFQVEESKSRLVVILATATLVLLEGEGLPLFMRLKVGAKEKERMARAAERHGVCFRESQESLEMIDPDGHLWSLGF